MSKLQTKPSKPTLVLLNKGEQLQFMHFFSETLVRKLIMDAANKREKSALRNQGSQGMTGVNKLDQTILDLAISGKSGDWSIEAVEPAVRGLESFANLAVKPSPVAPPKLTAQETLERAHSIFEEFSAKELGRPIAGLGWPIAAQYLDYFGRAYRVNGLATRLQMWEKPLGEHKERWCDSFYTVADIPLLLPLESEIKGSTRFSKLEATCDYIDRLGMQFRVTPNNLVQLYDEIPETSKRDWRYIDLHPSQLKSRSTFLAVPKTQGENP